MIGESQEPIGFPHPPEDGPPAVEDLLKKGVIRVVSSTLLDAQPDCCCSQPGRTLMSSYHDRTQSVLIMYLSRYST